MAQQIVEGTTKAVTALEATAEMALARAVDRSALRGAPFEHIQMENLFSAGFYRRMLETLPAAATYHPLLHRDALRADGSSTRLRLYLYPESLWRLPGAQRPFWRGIAAALRSPVLEAAFKRKFRLALEDRFQQAAERIPLYPVPILVRDLPGYRIGIHADAPIKAITVQLYLPDDRSQSHLGTIFHTTDRQDGSDRPLAMPFLPASGYAFAVRKRESWHSVPRTIPADGERRSIMLTYYVDAAWSAKLHRRKQRAAIFLGWCPRY
jgi:hypothetical protein